jgi:DNA polymerase elongation subunit (family B)
MSIKNHRISKRISIMDTFRRMTSGFSSNPFTDSISFQILDIRDRNVFPGNGILSPETLKAIQDRMKEDDITFSQAKSIESSPEYEVILSGTMLDGTPIVCRVKGFQPFFYIQLPEKISFPEMIQILEDIRDESSSGGKSKDYQAQSLKDVILPSSLESRQDLYWYRGGSKESYIKLSFRTKQAFSAWKNIFLSSDDPRDSPKQITVKHKGKTSKMKFKIYEANLEPLLRFLHATNLPACGWATIKSDKWILDEECDPADFSSGAIGIITDYQDIHPDEILSEKLAPILIASFDIECDSAHGDFPLAIKGLERFSTQILFNRKTLTPIILKHSIRNSFIAPADSKDESWGVFGKLFLKNMKTLTPAQIQKLDILLTEDYCKKLLDYAEENNKHALDACLNKTIGEFIKKELKTSIQGDAIIQIGTTFMKERKIIYQNMITLGSCAEIPHDESGGGIPIEIIACDTEEQMIAEWFKLIRSMNPDVITGYNINMFDFKYILDRMTELGIDIKDNEIFQCSRIPKMSCSRKNVSLSSAALGDVSMEILDIPGRVLLDMCEATRRNFANLESYKLDEVAKKFLNGKIIKIESSSSTTETESTLKIFTSNTFGIGKGSFIYLTDDDNEEVGGKIPVLGISSSSGTETFIEIPFVEDVNDFKESIVNWSKAKDDVSPEDIFRLYRGNDIDRSIVAKYCIQDCNLVLDLMNKLEILPNSMAMGSVCSVPLSYIFFRGQTIKLASLMFKICGELGFIIPVLPSPSRENADDSYEGAIVLEPKTGLYLDKPVAVLDYNSLYPSSMISENISHDSIVAIYDYDLEGKLIETQGNPELDSKIPPGDKVHITFDRLAPDPEDKRKHPEKIIVGKRTCVYAQFPDGKKGIVPTILMGLLKKRKDTKKRMEAETDPFKKGLLDALQLAYKVTANSLYGALGAKSSKIRFIDLAASTTAFGRKLIMYAKTCIEKVYGGGSRADCDAEYVYGDTDSVFIAFNPKNPDGTLMKGLPAVQRTIELGLEAETILASALRPPHVPGYEKTFYPFMLFSKKRYIGNKYEMDTKKFKQANMGVVLKRRDNAPIVKEIYQSVVDTILNKRDLKSSVDVAKKMLNDLVEGRVSFKKLTITKSLRANYANPDSIAHKVLADRIGERDPGNRPKANDRIAYMYYRDPRKYGIPSRQGDRIETPEYIRSHGFKPDYEFYITNQIMKPLTQLFQLFWEQVPECEKKFIRGFHFRKNELHMMNPMKTPEQIRILYDKDIEDDIQLKLFVDSIRKSKSSIKGPMDKLFAKSKKTL